MTTLTIECTCTSRSWHCRTVA